MQDGTKGKAMSVEKIEDLIAEKQRRLLQRLVEELSKSNPELYYQPTSQIARELAQHIAEGTGLIHEERELLQQLDQRGIEMLLSLHS